MGTTYSDPSLQSADIVAGTTAVNNSAASTTIITVPAGRVWTGSVAASVIDTAAAAATFSSVNVITAGTGVSPAAGTIVLQVITTPGGNGSTGNSLMINSVIVRAPAANAVTINIQASAAATTLQASATCDGILAA